MSEEERRVYLGAVINPVAAMRIHRDMGDHLKRMIRQATDLGQLEEARHLSSALAQLREAARQYLERTSLSGTGELPALVAAPESESAPRWVPTAVVAKELDRTPRQVRNLVAQGRLLATTVGGRLLIDPVSMANEIERRGIHRGDSG